MRVHIAAHKIILVIALAALLPSMAFAAPQSWSDGADALRKAQDWQGLLAYSLRWTKAEPGHPFGWYNLDSAYKKMGRYQESIEPLREAVRLDPDYANAWYSLAVAYKSLGRVSEAADAIEKANRLQEVRK